MTSLALQHVDTPTREQRLTLRNASSDPFSMYSVIIITGLPGGREGEKEGKGSERMKGR